MKQLELEKSEVYFRDRFVPFNEASLNIASSPVMYGLSIYTVFSVGWNEQQQKLYIFRLRDHYNRLVNSAKIMDFHNFVLRWSFPKFKETMTELLRRNQVEQDALVRATVFIDETMAGTKIHGLKNNMSAFVYPAGQILPKEGASVCISSWQRLSDNAIPARAKVNGGYINASLMKNEALLNGYDDAIAIDNSGHVTESTVANVFLVRDGVLITPDGANDILEGITRSSIMSLAKRLQIPVAQRAVDRSELYIADEVFLCGSSVRVCPVLAIDKRVIGAGSIGPITAQLAREYDHVQHARGEQLSGWLSEA